MLDKAKNPELLRFAGFSVTPPDENQEILLLTAKKYIRSFSPVQIWILKRIGKSLLDAGPRLRHAEVPATRGSYDAKVFRLETPRELRPDKPASASSPAGLNRKLAELNYRQGRGQYDQLDYWVGSAIRQQCA